MAHDVVNPTFRPPDIQARRDCSGHHLLTRGAEVVETKLTIGLDRRAPYTVADRKAQFDAVMKAHGLFDDMTKLAGWIDGARDAVRDRLKGLPNGDEFAKKLRTLADKLEGARKQIVATNEGGAITGEECIREHLDQLYGALDRWEGRPAGTSSSASMSCAASSPTSRRRSK